MMEQSRGVLSATHPYVAYCEPCTWAEGATSYGGATGALRKHEMDCHNGVHMPLGAQVASLEEIRNMNSKGSVGL